MAESYSNDTLYTLENKLTANIANVHKNEFSVNQIEEYGNILLTNIINSVSFLEILSQVGALLYGGFRLISYRTYSVEKLEHEKCTSVLFNWQVKCHSLISWIWITQFILQILAQTLRLNTTSILAQTPVAVTLLTGTCLWPLVKLLLQYENTHKFSTSINEAHHHSFFKIFWNATFILEIVGFTCKFFMWSHISRFENFLLGFAFAKLFLLSTIIYFGIHKVGFPQLKNEEKDEDSKSKDDSKVKGDDEEPEKTLEERIMDIRKQWSLLRKYMVLNSKSKTCILVCLGTVAVDRIVGLYSDIVEKYLNSMSVAVNTSVWARESTTDQNTSGSTFKLEFRWDFLVLATVLNIIRYDFSQKIRDYMWDIVSKEMSDGTQVKMYRKVQDLSLRWHLEKRCGETLSVIQYGTNELSWFLRYTLFDMLPEWLDVIIYLIYVGSVYPRVLNSVIFVTTIASLALHFFSVHWKSKMKKAKRDADENQVSDAIDSLINYETVKYFTNEEFEAKRFESALNASLTQERNMDKFDKWESIAYSVLRNSGSLIGSLICYWMIVNNDGLTVGDYHMFGAHLFRFYYPIISLTTLHCYFKDATDDLDRMTSVLEAKPEVEDLPDATELKITEGEITFKDVHFHYVEERKILQGISFTVPSGKTFALVGSTGSGKSTMIRLLFRFYDTTSGSILIDGQDIKTVTQQSLRKAVGVIPQDTVLFHTTIRKNILYGNLTSTNPDEEVIVAAKHACIHDRVLTFPDKYESIVGERGLMLSGGERQRVSIARALMKNPPILLLDEATSSLDTHTERQIQSTLEDVCKNRTTLIIAHRLSTVINANKILVLDNGSIVESGSHSELLNQGGMYAKMWNDQVSLKSEESTEKSTPTETLQRR